MRDVIAELREEAKCSEAEFTEGAAGYSAFDVMGVELEVAEFLFALVRLHKPNVVVESGAGSGYSTLAIAGALERNRVGHLFSYEPMEKYRDVTRNRLGAIAHATVVDGDSRQHPDEECVDLVFLDSGPVTREREILYWLYRSVVLVVHDAYRYVAMLERMPNSMMLHNPRGLWVRVPAARK